MTYDNNNSGALFKNKEPQSEKSPVYTGKATVKGQQFYISAWINESKEGEKYMSLKFKEPEINRPAQKERSQYQPQDDGDSIPF